MNIRLYNTLTRQTERLQPLDPDNVRLYCCGPTVYDRAHIGNARPVVVFDTLFRLLRQVYGPEHVTYVRNITDVDDKINARAAETGRSIGQITAETTAWYHADMAAIGALRPTHEPRATNYIPQMIAMIETLIAGGHAYVADGHVLFDVRSYAAYGALARRSLEDMIAGARVDVADYKRDPMDFVLWKPAGDGPGWDSPWGTGRPGWHIECSAMAKALLGPRFDIHGGGIDLQFPHHENELAQSCCANANDKMASIWMHNGFVQVEGEKMSKSLGNFLTVHDLLAQGIPGPVLRFVLLSTHYAKPIDWTAEKARAAHEKLLGWARLIAGVTPGAPAPEALSALADDLNTPLVLGKILSDLSRDESAAGRARFAGTLELVGLDLSALSGRDSRLDALEERLLKARNEKDFATSDALRDGLIAAGYKVQIGKNSVEITAGPGADPARLDEL